MLARAVINDRGAYARTRPALDDQTWGEAVDLSDVPVMAWSDLVLRAGEANAFLQPGWALAIDAHATGRGGARALLAWDSPARRRLLGLVPVVSAWNSLMLPLPVLVGWQPYAALTTPLLDGHAMADAARGLLIAAAQDGAHALLLPSLPIDGAAARALRDAVPFGHPEPKAINCHQRALLDANGEPDAMLRTALGAKKLKELRRQRHRLADAGEVTLRVARTAAELTQALDAFLAIEAAGWKGARGTALATDPGDTAFIRQAVASLSEGGQIEILTLLRGDDPIAAGIVLRHLRRAFFFKMAYDEQVARLSPGVQLTLDLTRHLCADPEVDDADSVAVADHPMIDHVWPGRLAVADMLIPVRAGAAGFHSLATMIEARHTLREVARRAVHAVRS
jgi:CelD/BcsL family acetyltransferase involved in cellulose biosynthesis